MRKRPTFITITTRVVTLVIVSATFTAFVVWLGTRQDISPLYIFPLAITASALVASAVAGHMVEPLRQATKAARAMAHGDYSMRVNAPPGDEIGQLSEAFNSMARDLAKVDRLHRDVVANVSHELRTPVTALRSLLENMVDGVEEPSPENLTKALRQAEKLTELLQFLLDLSRLEAGVIDLDLHPLSVAGIVSDAVETASLAAAHRGEHVQFVATVDPTNLKVIADAGRMSQLLVNLLDNATRHAPPGSDVLITATKARNNLRIDISDSGPGIRPEDRERIFTRFQMGQDAPDKTGGTGIGLAIAKWAASLHGGTVDVMDAEVGAWLRIHLPLTGPEGKTKRSERDT